MIPRLISRLASRRLAPYLVAVAVAVASTFAMVAGPSAGTSVHRADYVVVAGAAGLRWDDLSPTGTPNLWRLAQQGSIGALSVRSARSPTCAADGWLTLGAGNYAQRTFDPVDQGCPQMSVTIQRPDAIGAFLPDQETVVGYNRQLSYGSQPGALAEAVRCVSAVGPGAAVGAARPYGRVDRYAPTLTGNLSSVLGSCVLSMVDLGTVRGDTPAVRAQAAKRVDAALAAVLAARPQNSLVLVGGVSDTEAASRLHVAIADGPGYRGGWLTSSSTSRPGYLQLVDLTPTILAALGKPPPARLVVGQPAQRIGQRPADLATAVARLSDADREAGAQHRVAGRFFGLLTLIQLIMLAAVIPVLRRSRRQGRGFPEPVSPSVVRVVEVALIASALAIPAALLADAVPWWRGGHAGTLFTLVLLAVLAPATALVVASPLRRRSLGPIAVVSAAAALVVAVDVVTGSRLQINGVAGYSALEGLRYTGLGPVGLGIFLAGSLLTAACLAQRASRHWRPAVVAAVGGVAVVLVGSPSLGIDGGGAVAVTAGAALAAALSVGGWLTFARVAWATLAGLAVTSAFAVLDLRRAPAARGTLGRFLAQLQDGTGGLVIHRTATANVTAVLTSPLTFLVLGVVAFVMLAMLRPWGGLRRLFGIHPAVKAGLVGIAIAAPLAGMIDGVGLTVAGAAAATAVPLMTLAALRTQYRADRRTEPAPGADPLPQADRGPGVPLTAGYDGAATADDAAEEAGFADASAEAEDGEGTAGAPRGSGRDVLA